MQHDANRPPQKSAHHTTRFDMDEIKTPAMIVDEERVTDNLKAIRAFADDMGCKLYYSVKASPMVHVLKLLAKDVDGFSCSSIMEAKLAQAFVRNTDKDIHFVSPCIKRHEIQELTKICSSMSFNSLSQWDRFAKTAGQGLDCVLRINPHVSLTPDERIDACRQQSKLGVSVHDLKNMQDQFPDLLDGLSGVHVHNAVGNRDFANLKRTVDVLEDTIPDVLKRVRWINLGGGYRLPNCKNLDLFRQTVERLKSEYGLEVIIEPGGAMLKDCCHLVATVEDLFTSEGQNIAVVDTSINHHLEPYIYGFPHRVRDTGDGLPYTYTLAGSTCLAGDLLGTHGFKRPLKIGSRVVFGGVGAYTLPLTTQYNGEAPPNIYTLTKDNVVYFQRKFGFEDFMIWCGARRKRPVT